MFFKNKKRGASLLEMVVYVGIAALVFVVVMGSILVVMDSYKKLKEGRSLKTAAFSINDRLIQEIRNAYGVDNLSSVFGTSPGTLVLQTKNQSGINITREISASSSRVFIKTDGVLDGYLSGNEVRLSSLTFWLSGTTTSKAISFSFDLTVGTSSEAYTTSFQNTAVLRGSYQGL